MSRLVAHFHADFSPTDLDTNQINDYLYLVQQEHPTASDSYFKFTVYGLRFAFRMMGLKNKHIELPSINPDCSFLGLNEKFQFIFVQKSL